MGSWELYRTFSVAQNIHKRAQLTIHSTMTPATPSSPRPAPPYRLACLCDLRDKDGRILLLRRAKSPNRGLCSPIGGKLDVATGESPARCAQREIHEEAGVLIPLERLHLLGLISEQGFQSLDGERGAEAGNGHWLLFYFRVLGAVNLDPPLPRDTPEGRLEWFHPSELDALPIPDTDRTILWPLIAQTEPRPTAAGETTPGFFSVHIDASGATPTSEVHQLMRSRAT